jgi:hypothetical protein
MMTSYVMCSYVLVMILIIPHQNGNENLVSVHVYPGVEFLDQ